MPRGFYELIKHPDPGFPIVFHDQHFLHENSGFMPHWHEGMELLYFVKGEATVFIDGLPLRARAGDLMVSGFNSMHSMQDSAASTKYYCLIVDPSLCAQMGLASEDLQFQPQIRDKRISSRFKQIVSEFQAKAPYYKTAVKADIASMFIYLLRHFLKSPGDAAAAADSKIAMVKSAIGLIQKNYAAPLSLSSLAAQVGFSRYYLCHVFHEITGYPISKYLNILRCTNAKKLLTTGWTVGEAAAACGFENLSYFTRTYKNYMGRAPSADKSESESMSTPIRKILPYS